jgi:hypothetical protein
MQLQLERVALGLSHDRQNGRWQGHARQIIPPRGEGCGSSLLGLLEERAVAASNRDSVCLKEEGEAARGAMSTGQAG